MLSRAHLGVTWHRGGREAWRRERFGKGKGVRHGAMCDVRGRDGVGVVREGGMALGGMMTGPRTPHIVGWLGGHKGAS